MGSLTIGVNLDKKSGGALTMARAECKPITGVWAEPPAGTRAEPWSEGQGAKPPEAESFLRIGHPKEGANWWSDCHESHLVISCLVHHRRQLHNRC